MKETKCGGGQPQSQGCSLFIGHMAGYSGNHMLAHNSVKLESTFAGPIRLLTNGYSTTRDPVTDFEAGKTWANLNNGSSYIESYYHRVSKMGHKHPALILHKG